MEFQNRGSQLNPGKFKTFKTHTKLIKHEICLENHNLEQNEVLAKQFKHKHLQCAIQITNKNAI